MSNETETNTIHKDSDTIEEKRRKNVIDNQHFLENLKLFNVRDDLKSAVNSVTTTNKSSRKKSNRKQIIDSSEIRRSSRIQSMPQINYNNQSIIDDKDFIVSTDETSNDEEEDDLSSAFTNKTDKDWQPLHAEKISIMEKVRPIRKTTKIVSDNVKIFMPNIGLQASKVVSKTNTHKSYVSKKMNVAISSSSSSEED
ncbi:unnamed protein product [Rotaria sordida]|uniref:Uncharacterized protein n=1 Tax=Rotaria sordida TaxID=392033 RepID=A0A813W2L2_9BILA|nr:unnamed protein product [Rotaria sordida]CAF0854630.1 unnamed protein product [Rotaria sordida]CAF3701984.1 unnamed protein product [Rotaria sordida]CAF3707779.1 unnamed protein product [Rotaria sordida]